MNNEALWGKIAMILVLLYVTVGGGYEIYLAFVTKHVHSTFIFSFLSSLIFVSRVLYAISSKARRTLWADVYGAVVMLLISCLHFFYQ